MHKVWVGAFFMLAASCGIAAAKPSTPGQENAVVSIPVYSVDARGVGVRIGTIDARDSVEGVRLKLDIKGLPPGLHGFHVHRKADCGPAMVNGRMVPAGAASTPLDPHHTGHHAGPTGDGYLGDLPVISVSSKGEAKYTIVARRVKLADLHNRALLIKAGGDNYSDKPLPMGGGGDAIACGPVR